MSGLTTTGFTKKDLATILAEINAEQKAKLGAAWNTDPDSVIGVINGIVAEKLAEEWEALEAVYASQYPNTASGTPLDNVAAITGAKRLPATKSTVVIRCAGDDGTVLAVGRKVLTDPAGDVFVSTEEHTIGEDVSGYVDITFTAEEFGPVRADTGTATIINTEITGWDSATNAADAELGRNVETDEDFRVRRVALLAQAGASTISAIRAQVFNVDGVTEVRVFENDTDTTDGDGVPPHAVEVVVRGGDDEEVRAAVFSAAGGIEKFGTETGTITDDEGIDHDVAFSRPTEKILEINVEVEVDPDLYGAGDDDAGDQLVKDALAAYLADLQIGDDIIRNKLFTPIFTVAGVLNVATLEIRFNPPGGSFVTTTLTVSPRELATIDTANITVEAT